MSDSQPKPGAPSDGAPETGTGTLTKEQRKELLAQIERTASRAESPSTVLRRAEADLREGRLDAARRQLGYLEARAPELTGLDLVKRRLQEAEARAKYEANLRKAEEMLTRYIQQRKKPLAKLALDALLEIEPEHPRRRDFEIWVADLDQEVAFQQRVDNELEAGRAALQAEDLTGARRRLDALRKLDPDGPAAEQLAREMAELEHSRVESAGIDRSKQRFEQSLERGDLTAAGEALEELGRLSVSKVTLDFLRQRLEAAHGQARDRKRLQDFERDFHRHLSEARWQAAREVAQEVGRRFRGNPRSAAMIDEVSRLEAEARRRQSIEQGIATLEGFLAKGQRREAELALRVLQGLSLEPRRLASLEARVKQL